MSWDKGFNFRNTSGFVTDGANETYVLPTDSYPVTRNGVTFGWGASVDGYDRDNTADRRLAGVASTDAYGTGVNFVVDPPAAGKYICRLAAGDISSAISNDYVVIQAPYGTVLATIYASTLSGDFLDATGTDRTKTAWPTDNASITLTLPSGSAYFTPGGSYPKSGDIAHIFLSQITPITGTGSVSPRSARSGTGVLNFGGTGSAKPRSARSATGTLGFSGTCQVKPRTARSGTAALTFSGSGGIAGAHMSVTGVGVYAESGNAGTGMVMPRADVSGTGALIFPGTALVKPRSSRLAAAALIFSGTGSVAPRTARSGTAALVFAGTGSVHPGTARSGTGVETFTGTASRVMRFDAAGSGLVATGIAGTGSVSPRTARSGTAALTFTGSDGPTMSTARSGTAALIFSGTGSIAAHMSVAGDGSEALPGKTGTGSAHMRLHAFGRGASVTPGSSHDLFRSPSGGTGNVFRRLTGGGKGRLFK